MTTSHNQGYNDDLLVYTIPNPDLIVEFSIPSNSRMSSESARTPLIQVYNRQRRPTSIADVVLPLFVGSTNDDSNTTNDEALTWQLHLQKFQILIFL